MKAQSGKAPSPQAPLVSELQGSGPSAGGWEVGGEDTLHSGTTGGLWEVCKCRTPDPVNQKLELRRRRGRRGRVPAALKLPGDPSSPRG